MQVRGQQAGFEPIYSPTSQLLILGSYPSPKSFEHSFYYGHPQNRFWTLLPTLLQKPIPQTIAEKTALLIQNGIALWDVLASCEIMGASDVSIKNPVPNDIASLLAKTQIKAVFCNGAASYKFYTNYCQAKTGLAAQCLPSTSPANAAYTMQRLLDAWAPIQHYTTT